MFCPLWGKEISLACSDRQQSGPLSSFGFNFDSDFHFLKRGSLWTFIGNHTEIFTVRKVSAMLVCSSSASNTVLLRIRYVQRVLSLKPWRLLGRSNHLTHFSIKQSCLSYVISSMCILLLSISAQWCFEHLLVFLPLWHVIISHLPPGETQDPN